MGNVYPFTYATTIAKHRPKVQSQQDQLLDELEGGNSNGRGSGDVRLSYENFSMAVDEFFLLLEGQKRAMRAEAAEQSAMDRLEKIKRDQSKRMVALEKGMVKVREHAELVEAHGDDVDKALGVNNSALDSGMNWVDQADEFG